MYLVRLRAGMGSCSLLMRLIRVRLFIITAYFLFIHFGVSAQNFSFNCSRDTLIPGCPPNLCFTLQANIPDIKALSSSYTLNPGSNIPGCFPVYVAPNDPAGTPTALLIDDRYSSVIPLNFPFNFYGVTYNSLVASTNGYLSFDISLANGGSHWQNLGDLPTASYDRALIMGPYHDLDPSLNPSINRIQYQLWGVAPHRRWVLSFYRVSLFNCASLMENTHQIILYESTGIIEVKIFDKQICGWNSGKAMVGIQDATRTKGMTAPARKMSDPPWGFIGMNETWRFVPDGGASLFKRVELLDMTGAILATGTVAPVATGVLQASFPNTCAPAGVITSYQVRSVYTKNDDPTVEIYGIDTVRVNRVLPPPDATVTSSNTTCNGASDGTVTVSASAMPGPYTFSLDGGPPVAGTIPFTFFNVPVGSHTVVVTGAAGCLTTTPIPADVSAGPTLLTTATASDALCNGSSTGTITVAVPTMGTPPYEYSLDGVNWQSSNVFTGLPANIYRVYYRTTNGCQNDLTITINEPAAVTISNTVVPVTCNGGTDGTITVTAGGGTPGYEFSIDGINWQSSNIFTIGAGTYTVRVRDVNGCIRTRVENVTEPAVLSANSVNTNASCDGGDDGTITVTATGGNTGGYQYSLDNVNWQNSNVFNVGPNSFTVYVKDNKGCSFNFPAQVGLTNNLTFTPMADQTICEGSAVQLNLVSNATIYTWTPSGGLNNPNIANPVASPTVTTPYDVTATLGRCSIQDNVIVMVNPAPVPDAGPDGFICYGQTYQLQGSGGIQYSWSPAKYLDVPLSAAPLSTPRETITYTLSIVSDMNGCPSLVTDDMVVDVTPPVKIYTFPSDTIVYPGDQFQLRAVSSVPAANMFSWSPVINLNNPVISNPVVTAGNAGDSLVYKVTATSAAGCMGEGYVRLRVYKGPELYTPNAFTPNGDGKNDSFYPFPVGIKAINYFRVYNRWGQLVFSSNTLYKGWDGRFNGTEQGAGTFVWMAQGVDKNNKTLTRQGTVTLIR